MDNIVQGYVAMATAVMIPESRLVETGQARIEAGCLLDDQQSLPVQIAGLEVLLKVVQAMLHQRRAALVTAAGPPSGLSPEARGLLLPSGRP